LIPLK